MIMYDMTNFFFFEIWRIHMCDMTQVQVLLPHPLCSYVHHDSFICVTWLVSTRYGSCLCVTRSRRCYKSVATSPPIFMCDMTHSCVWRLMHVCDMTHSCVWNHSFLCVTWLIHMCDMTHPCVWHDSFVCVMRLTYMRQALFKCVTWLIHTCDMTHSYVWHDSFICVTW